MYMQCSFKRLFELEVHLLRNSFQSWNTVNSSQKKQFLCTQWKFPTDIQAYLLLEFQVSSRILVQILISF